MIIRDESADFRILDLRKPSLEREHIEKFVYLFWYPFTCFVSLQTRVEIEKDMLNLEISYIWYLISKETPTSLFFGMRLILVGNKWSLGVYHTDWITEGDRWSGWLEVNKS